jgi:molybdopterin molybdotransferase
MIKPPPLSNDCFALPQGVAWRPVDQALAALRSGLHPIVEMQHLPLLQSAGLVLAKDAVAERANPPHANSAVDGYGFLHAATGQGPQVLPLNKGRAAAGQAYCGAVSPGHAIRVLTGAMLPNGVDTVVLEEDCTITDAAIAFHGPLKQGSNARAMGEDIMIGDTLVAAGQRLRPPELALLASAGISTVSVYRRLRVAILSTGEELRDPGETADPGQIYDANRPMLASLLKSWGHEVVDLGRIPDDPDQLRTALDTASCADAILTSGGASAGDEDHVSALLKAEGALQSWRIALKPGRPLALALWRQTPVFGLPGNPVAAFVCALIFARPALSKLSGAGWAAPLRMQAPAAFSKTKKPGRHEYLRARLTSDGAVEIFKSEGSGRISGLSWADGLVELGSEAEVISPGRMVTYLPYVGFGL